MNLAEIFVQLPDAMASFLEQELEEISIPLDPTKAEVLFASLDVVQRVMAEFPAEAEKIQDLLDQLPQAIVDHLF